MSDLLKYLGITDKKTWHQWILTGHPDKGGDEVKFEEASYSGYDFELTYYRQDTKEEIAEKEARKKKQQAVKLARVMKEAESLGLELVEGK